MSLGAEQNDHGGSFVYQPMGKSQLVHGFEQLSNCKEIEIQPMKTISWSGVCGRVPSNMYFQKGSLDIRSSVAFHALPSSV